MAKSRCERLASIAVFSCIASVTSAARDHDGPATTAAAKVRHVFLIVLENKNFSDTFGTSTQDPYLQKTLVPMGGLLTEYYGTGHVSLDNYISMISGMAPTPDGQGLPDRRQRFCRLSRLGPPQAQIVQRHSQGRLVSGRIGAGQPAVHVDGFPGRLQRLLVPPERG